ncbi:MAG: penicillin-binding protein 1C [Bradymonadaceae bacterium]|nr:penicillin-binding protein 1C [Lujinxingiaceae bacterium]
MKRALLYIAIAITLLLAALLTAARLTPLPERLNERDSTVITWADGQPAHVFLAPDGRWRLTTRLADVDPHYIGALISFEDRRFYTHHGVDPIAVVRAARSNLTQGRVVSGASTLTMQLVRMVEPRPRTLRSKLVEAFRAVQIELHMSKTEILEAYLRFLPFGRNIEGLETAAFAYFGHDASALSPAEIATLLAVPQSPNRRYPRPENFDALTTARNAIAAELLELGTLPRGAMPEHLTDADALAQILATRAPDTLQPLPREMPHMAVWLKQRYPNVDRLETTIEASTQRVVERLASNHRARILPLGARNAAIVVVDHRSGALRAATGNFDFDDNQNGGQIPGFDVRRSTGSLLKPFLLAQAIDRGVAAPSHLVADVPVDYAGYSPLNYAGSFSGLVRLDEALVRSLNIPFVQLAGTVGVGRFLGLLQHLGAEGVNTTPGHYGLSVAVGGIEASPLEVASMYTALARSGDPAPLHLLDAAHTNAHPALPSTSGQALSPEATYLVRDILTKRDRPDFAQRSRLTARADAYAWKTGTSMGFRDAWTAGFGPTHTVVVWTGNFDNRSQTGIIGSQAATPLFFDVLEAVDPVQSAPFDPAPAGIAKVSVCAYSGHLPTAACPHTERVSLPKRSVPTAACPYHVQLDIDATSAQALSPACRAGRTYETRSFVVWPSDVRRHMQDRGMPPDALPPFAPGCTPNAATAGPIVTSPPPDATLALIAGLDLAAQHVPLEAVAHDSAGDLSWFADGEFLGTVSAGERLWWKPRPGQHAFVVIDAEGRSARRLLTVR